MNYLQENKNHIISQLPELSPEEKEEVKRYFNTHANLENQVDWNKSNWDNLTFEYFIQNFINNPTKTAKKKAVKASGINGLSEGEDYLLVYQGEYTKENGDTGIIEGYVPLSYEASKHIASKSVGSDRITGEWCIAWQKSREYWDSHAKDSFFVIFVDYHDRGESTNELDWGKEAVQFKVNRQFSLKQDVFQYSRFEKTWDRYDNNEDKPNPIFITNYIFDDLNSNIYSPLMYTIINKKDSFSTSDIDSFGMEVSDLIKKSRGISREVQTIALKTFVTNLDNGVAYMLATSKPKGIINSIKKDERDFTIIQENTEYTLVYCKLLYSESFGMGLVIGEISSTSMVSSGNDHIADCFLPFPMKHIFKMMKMIFPEGDIYQLPAFKDSVKEMIGSNKIKYVIYSNFTNFQNKEIHEVYKEFLDTPWFDTYFSNGPKSIKPTVSSLFVGDDLEIDIQQKTDELFSEIKEQVNKIVDRSKMQERFDRIKSILGENLLKNFVIYRGN